MVVNSLRAPSRLRGQPGVSTVCKTKCGEKTSSINASSHFRKGGRAQREGIYSVHGTNLLTSV